RRSCPRYASRTRCRADSFSADTAAFMNHSTKAAGTRVRSTSSAKSRLVTSERKCVSVVPVLSIRRRSPPR
ncbi:MAG: hypothetical protein ACHQRO_10050, partial [Vicinamibacteria bacterium]